MRRVLVAALLLAAACTSTATTSTIDASRRIDEEAVAAREADFETPAFAQKWIVVERGQIVASASLADDAIRAAKGATSAHRFVFRPADRGSRLYRLAFVAEGGIVVGRKFLADLGIVAAGAVGRPAVLRRKAGGLGLDLAKSPRIAIEIASLDGATHRSIDAAYDPDFDGGLLVPPEIARDLALERFEIPGDAEVQVALGRPFRARRAVVTAKIPSIDASGAAEAVYEVASARN